MVIGNKGPSVMVNNWLTGVDGVKEATTNPTEQLTEKVSTLQLFQFADPKDVFLVLVGIIFSICAGLGWPALAYIFGSMLNSFLCFTALFLKQRAIERNATAEDQCILAGAESVCSPNIVLEDEIKTAAVQFSIVGFMVWFAYFMYLSTLGITAERQTRRMRDTFFHSVMRQEMRWFDTTDAGELAAHLTEDVDRVHEGIGEGIGSLVNALATFIGGITLGFIIDWKLSAVVVGVSPLLVGVTAFMSIVRKLLRI
jgi:ABC-type multidrug transport system fused ATPase/permease subunit